nr:iron-containing alcohol dehydrogenase [Alkalicoccus daliensis]
MFYAGSPFLPWRQPELLQGKNSMLELPLLLKQKKLSHPLIVTDKGVMQSSILTPLLEALKNSGIAFTIYDETVPNPTIENIEQVKKLYEAYCCDAIIAAGGGSPIDCAKGAAARIARPQTSIPAMRGVLRIRTQLPPFFAVPTTAGTGSEVTVACVVTDSSTHEKYALMDPSLIPHYAVLDPLLTVTMPPSVTAATGMDALTHAVEAYIGRSNTAETRAAARKAVKLVLTNLEDVYHNGEDIEKRAAMQEAAYAGGVAFTRAFIGNVHAIAHNLGGLYGYPHGLANAVLLPCVLRQYGTVINERLAELADLIPLTARTASHAEKAEAFISRIEKMNKKMNIPETIDVLKEKDFPVITQRALKEANPLYPVPKIFSEIDMYEILQKIRK